MSFLSVPQITAFACRTEKWQIRSLLDSREIKWTANRGYFSAQLWTVIKQLSTQGYVFTTVITVLHNLAYCLIFQSPPPEIELLCGRIVSLSKKWPHCKQTHSFNSVTEYLNEACYAVIVRFGACKLALVYVKALTFPLALLCTCWLLYVKRVKRTSSPLRAFHPRASAVRDCAGVRCSLPLYR